MSNKKGVVEIQFNWIFILIVGGIILLFFIGIVMQQNKVSTQKIEATVSLDMGSIFSGAQISTNTEHIVDIPPIDMYFICDETDYSSYRVGNAEIPLGEGLIVFSPDKIEGNQRELLSWTLDWNVPYRATNFLYVTSPLMRYIILEDGSYGDILYEQLPDKLDKDEELYSDIMDVDNRNNYKIRFLVMGSNSFIFGDIEEAEIELPEKIASMADSDVSMVYISPKETQNNFEGYGDVYYLRKSDSNLVFESKSEYLGKASMFGAIFSENKVNYECNMRKAYKRLELLTNVYVERADALVSYYNQTPDPQKCKSRIGEAKEILTQIKSGASGGFSNSASNMYSNSGKLKNKNKEIQRYSCPVIY